MRLEAIYIPKGVLDHIFGPNHEGLTLNLGGKYLYNMEENNEIVSIKERKINPKFIESFWPNNIKLVSAIVGENGTGKTTILDLFRDPNSFVSYVYLSSKNDKPIITSKNDKVKIIYYSAFFDIKSQDAQIENFTDLSKHQLMLDDTEFENINLSSLLELYNSENLKRWIKFIELKDLGGLLQEMSLPSFDKIRIEVKPISIKVYQTSLNFRPFFEALKKRIEQESLDRVNEEARKFKLTKKGDLLNSNVGQRIKLELAILDRIILKTQSILEAVGNKYLEEGHLINNYKVNSVEFTTQPSAKEAFYWFLANSYIQLNTKSPKIYFPIEEIKNLIETLLDKLPENEAIENWAMFDVDLQTALKIQKAYNDFILAFKDDFALDRKILLTFKPYINLSSGEKGLYDLFSALNELNYKIEHNIETSNSYFNLREKKHENILILLDEADLCKFR